MAQVVIIHSPNRHATEIAVCISAHLKETDAGLAIEVAPNLKLNFRTRNLKREIPKWEGN